MDTHIRHTTSKIEAVNAIDEFFSVFHLVEAKEELEIIETSILSNSRDIPDEKREELIYFCNKLRELINAAHELRTEQ